MSDLHAPQSIYPTQVLLAGFNQYLQTEKSVSDATRECYGRHVRRFLSTFGEAGDQVLLAHLTAPKIRRYVTNLAEIYAPGSVKLTGVIEPDIPSLRLVTRIVHPKSESDSRFRRHSPIREYS